MSVKTITENLKSKDFQRLYYIYGDEEYLKRHYYSQLMSESVTALPEFNAAELDGRTFDLAEFENITNGYPAMSDRKAVGVIDFDNSLLKKNFTADFTEVLRQIPDFCTVVFLDTQLKSGVSNTALLKAIDGSGGVCAKVDKPSLSGLASWAVRHFKSEGKSIAGDDIRYMLEIADTDMLSLSNEISKLCSGVAGDTVTRRDIDRLVTRSIEANRFEIIDAFCNGDYDRVNSVIDRLYRQNIDDIMIANVFYRAFLDLWHARTALDSGKTQSDMVRDFSMKPFAAAKALKNAKSMSPQFLHDAVLLCLKLDRELKSTPFNKRDLITVFLADVTGRRRRG